MEPKITPDVPHTLLKTYNNSSSTKVPPKKPLPKPPVTAADQKVQHASNDVLQKTGAGVKSVSKPGLLDKSTFQQQDSSGNPVPQKKELPPFKQIVESCTPPVISAEETEGRRLLEAKLAGSSAELSPEESMTLLMECLRLGNIEAEKARGKDLVVLAGNTEVGKSTFINFACGCEMESKPARELGINIAGKRIVVKKGSAVPELMPIGHSRQSMTFIPKLATDAKGLTYCDTPGFHDTRGFEIKVANAINIRNVLRQARSVKVVILINYKSFELERGQSVLKTFKTIKKLFGSIDNLEASLGSVVLGISHVPRKATEDKTEDLEDLKKWICDVDNVIQDPNKLNIFQTLANRLFIFDPCGHTDLIYDGALVKDDQIRNKIEELEAVQDSKKIFQTALTDEDRLNIHKFADNVTSKIVAILNSSPLNEQDCSSIERLYKSLNTLKTIESEYVDNLINSSKKELLSYLTSLSHQFEICCVKGIGELLEEAESLHSQIQLVVKHLDDGEIYKALKLDELQRKLSFFKKTLMAKEAVLFLQGLEEKFRDACLQRNFISAKDVQSTIREKITQFDREFDETSVQKPFEIMEIDSFYEESKAKYDEEIKKQEDLQREKARLDLEQKNQQRMMSDQAKKKVELKKERYRQLLEGLDAERARLKQEKENAFRQKYSEFENYDYDSPLNKALRKGKNASELPKCSPDSMSLNIACHEKNPELVKAVIKMGAKPDKHTLTEAFYSNNQDILEAVLKAVMNLKVKVDNNALTYACMYSRNIETVNQVIALGAAPNEHTLTEACKSNNSAIVKAVLSAGAKPHLLTISAAKKTGNPEIINLVKGAVQNSSGYLNLLLKNLINTFTYNDQIEKELNEEIGDAFAWGAKPDENTLILYFNKRSHLKIDFLRQILQFSPKIDLKAINACVQGDCPQEILKALLEKGVKTDQTTLEAFLKSENQNESNFMLILNASTLDDDQKRDWVVTNSMYHLIPVCIKNGLKFKEDTLFQIYRNCNKEFFLSLLNKGLKVDKEVWKSIISKGDIETAKILIKKGMAPPENALDKSIKSNEPKEMFKYLESVGCKPTKASLTVACGYNKKLIPKLLDLGVVPDENTLSTAIRSGKKKLVNKMIEIGAKPDSESLVFYLRASKLGRKLIKKLDKPIDVESLKQIGWITDPVILQQMIDEALKPESKALSLAISNGDEDHSSSATKKLVMTLLQMGAKPSSDTLTLACRSTDLEIVEAVIKADAKPDKNTCEEAYETGYSKIIQAILACGALPSETCINHACRTKDIEIVRDLLEMGILPPQSSLSVACSTGVYEIVQLLIQHGAEPDNKTLRKACKTGDIQIVKAVLEAGAEPDDETVRIACETGDIEIVNAVLEVGAKPSGSDVKIALQRDRNMALALLKAGAKVSEDCGLELSEIIKMKDVELLEIICASSSAKVFYFPGACEANDVDIVKTLVIWGAEGELNSRKAAKETGDPEIIKLVNFSSVLRW